MSPTTSASIAITNTTTNTSPPKKSFTVAIVGGGLAGLTLAIGLLNQNVPFHIYESASAFAEIGLGVAFGPNAVRVLRLIDPRISEGYWKCATFNSNNESELYLSFRWGDDCRSGGNAKAGDLIQHVKWKGKNHGDAQIRTFCAVHRAKFVNEMIKLLPEGVVSFGKKLTDAVEVGHGVRLTFADGTSMDHSAVVGCDGIKSRTRQIMYPEMVPQFAGEYAYRALVPRAAANEALGEELAGNCQLYCGYGGYIITYPVDQGKLINMAGVRRTEKKGWSHEEWVIPSSKEDMRRDFEGWEPKLLDLILSFEIRDQWAFFDMPLEENYAKGRMCVVGDAAHASTPHLGSGAGMSFEDAYIMSNLLGVVRDEKDIPAAFQAFDATRRERTFRLVVESRRAGLMISLTKGVTDDLQAMERDMSARYLWIWEEDFQVMLTKALTKMKQLQQ